MLEKHHVLGRCDVPFGCGLKGVGRRRITFSPMDDGEYEAAVLAELEGVVDFDAHGERLDTLLLASCRSPASTSIHAASFSWPAMFPSIAGIVLQVDGFREQRPCGGEVAAVVA